MGWFVDHRTVHRRVNFNCSLVTRLPVMKRRGWTGGINKLEGRRPTYRGTNAHWEENDELDKNDQKPGERKHRV
jgi:hypothetical protein